MRTPPGFAEAYARYVEGGWNGLAADPDYGGQGLPLSLATPVVEMWNSACMSFALCPLLNVGAVELLRAHGSAEQKQVYLRKLVTGEWTGTMNLTEPQAGSDLARAADRAAGAGRRGITASPGRRSSSPMATTTSRRTSCNGAGAHSRRAARQQGDLALSRAEIPA